MPDLICSKDEKFHSSTKARIRRFFKEDGFTVEELAIMYKVHLHVIKSIVRGLKRPERI